MKKVTAEEVTDTVVEITPPPSPRDWFIESFKNSFVVVWLHPNKWPKLIRKSWRKDSSLILKEGKSAIKLLTCNETRKIMPPNTAKMKIIQSNAAKGGGMCQLSSLLQRG